MRGNLFLTPEAAEVYPFLAKGTEIWILDGDHFAIYTLDEPFDVLVWKSPDSYLDAIIDSIQKR